MRNKAPRILIAAIAVVSLAGLSAPAEAAPAKPTARTVWCC